MKTGTQLQRTVIELKKVLNDAVKSGNKEQIEHWQKVLENTEQELKNSRFNK